MIQAADADGLSGLSDASKLKLISRLAAELAEQVEPRGEDPAETRAIPLGPSRLEARVAGAARPSLPDPRLVRKIIRQRQLRARFFDGDLFADPAWDMLLDLTAARVEHRRVSVTSLCIASCVPPTTALRWIVQMTEAGLLERLGDEVDRRRAYITLTPAAVAAMAGYFAEVARTGVQSI